MTTEEIKDELYRMLSDVVNGGYPKRDNAQRGKYKQAVKEAVEVLEQTRWIPVSEKLPEESGYYLTNVFIDDCYFSEVCIRWFAHPDDYFITTGEWRECADDEFVTAWMSLPQYYKAESEDKE